MTNVVNLQGEPVEQAVPCKNAQIAHILEELYDLNNKGLLDAIVVGAVRVDLQPITYSTMPATSNIATLLGTIELAKKFYTDHLSLRSVPNWPFAG